VFRKMLLSLAIVAMLLGLSPGAEASGVRVSVDGRAVSGAFLAGGSTVVPLRDFCRSIAPGCSVSWDAQSRTASVRAEGLSLTARSGSPYITANGRCLYVGDNSFITDSGVFVLPVRTLAKAFGGSVHWSESTRQASVVSGSGAITPGSRFYREDEVFWLARIISAEARGEPLRGQIAVGNVVLNRVASPAYPNTIYGVIFDREDGVQFTPAANGSVYDEPTESAILAAKLALDGADVVGDCLYFLNESIATSFWIVENCSYVTTIGNHSFYA